MQDRWEPRACTIAHTARCSHRRRPRAHRPSASTPCSPQSSHTDRSGRCVNHILGGCPRPDGAAAAGRSAHPLNSANPTSRGSSLWHRRRGLRAPEPYVTWGISARSHRSPCSPVYFGCCQPFGFVDRNVRQAGTRSCETVQSASTVMRNLYGTNRTPGGQPTDKSHARANGSLQALRCGMAVVLSDVGCGARDGIIGEESDASEPTPTCVGR